MAAAVRTGWRRNAWPKARANDASRRGLAEAQRELYSGTLGPTGEDAIALLEQLRSEIANGRQAALPLRHAR